MMIPNSSFFFSQAETDNYYILKRGDYFSFFLLFSPSSFLSGLCGWFWGSGSLKRKKMNDQPPFFPSPLFFSFFYPFCVHTFLSIFATFLSWRRKQHAGLWVKETASYHADDTPFTSFSTERVNEKIKTGSKAGKEGREAVLLPSNTVGSGDFGNFGNWG